MSLYTGTATFDGGISQLFKASWSEARDAAVGSTIQTTNETHEVRGETGFHCGRAFLTFDLSSIPTNATYNSGSVVITVTSTTAADAAHGELQIVKSTSPSAGTLGTEDFDLRGDVDFGGTVDGSGTSTKTWTLNAAAGTYLTNDFGGNTQLCFITGKDFAGTSTAPTGAGNMNVASADNSTASFRPVLKINYTGIGGGMDLTSKYW